MEETKTIKEKTIELIDALKATCQTYGMGNDGNEYKIITQVFLYKFLNDKFGYEVKKVSPVLKNAEKWELAYAEMSEDDRLDIFDSLPSDIPLLNPEHLIANLWNQQAKGDFDLIFDSTMTDIADKNIDIFSTQTAQNTKIPLFEKLTQYVTDDTSRAPFARALVDKLVNFSFEEAFEKHYDFFADIFEYLIKDYNTAGGGKYAEYYTPHAIATIMARLLVGNATDLHSIECYDPSAGTGTLLMALAHKIGEDKCTIFAQDISQRSNKMLKLNLILNSLVSSLDHAIQGDTLIAPYHKSDNGQELRTFDYVVSNPPFKMDFSDTRERIESSKFITKKKSKVINFRVDRIASKPEILAKDIIPMPDDFDIENYTKEVFFMFSGEKVLVDLRCDNSLMKTMVDRFGEDVTTLAYDMTSFRVQTEVSASPTFFGWVFGFNGKVQILAPERVKEQYRQMIAKADENMQESE